MWQEKDKKLYKKFEFKDFDEAFAFIEKIAAIAKQGNHHPEFRSNFNEVEVWLTTHSAGGVTDKDQKLAQQIEEILSQQTPTKQVNLEAAKLFTDGGSRGNPGPAATGVAILDMEDNVVKKSGRYIGETTNNQAEYQALEEGIDIALSMSIKNLDVYMDSLLIVNQMKGLYKVKNVDLQPIYTSIKSKLNSFEKVSFTHVPRALNKIADSLVNEALDNR